MNHHPHSDLLSQFAKGELVTPLSSMISAHIELCSDCKKAYKLLTDQEGEDLVCAQNEMSAKDLDASFEGFLDLIERQTAKNARSEGSEGAVVDVLGRSFHLPKAFGFLRGQQFEWKEFGKKNAVAPMSFSQGGTFYLIYIGPGERVPEHGHSGSEFSYVAAGSYEDGISKYETGDFSLFDSSQTHSPVATSSGGCLVVSWVEGRLDYFKGILKPLNPLLWWYLSRA